MVKDPILLRTGLPRLFWSAFLSQFWSDINSNTCVILKKTLQSISLDVKKKYLDFFRKSHFESLFSTLNNSPRKNSAPRCQICMARRFHIYSLNWRYLQLKCTYLQFLFIYLLCHIYPGVPHQCAALFSLGLLHYMHDKTNINQHTFSYNTVTTLTTWYIHHYMHNVNYVYMFLITDTVVTCRCRFMFGQHYVQCIWLMWHLIFITPQVPEMLFGFTFKIFILFNWL